MPHRIYGQQLDDLIDLPEISDADHEKDTGIDRPKWLVGDPPLPLPPQVHPQLRDFNQRGRNETGPLTRRKRPYPGFFEHMSKEGKKEGEGKKLYKTMNRKFRKTRKSRKARKARKSRKSRK